MVTIKIPSIDLRDDPAYLKRFMMEEWVARRIDSPHVLKPCLLQRKRNFLYVVTEFIDGQTLNIAFTWRGLMALELPTSTMRLMPDLFAEHQVAP